MVAILIAALTHHIAEQDAALRRIDEVFGWAGQSTRVAARPHLLMILEGSVTPALRSILLVRRAPAASKMARK